MDKKNNEQKPVWSMMLFMIMALVASFSLLLTACTTAQNATTGQVVNNAKDTTPTKEQAINDPNSDIIVKDTKTVAEETQEQIQALIPDGLYEKELTYKYHSGEEKIAVSLTVENDVVTKASIEALGTPHAVSKKFITAVNDALPTLVVGKKVSEIEIPKQVSGSSLTTGAFKNYFESLKEQ